MPRPIFGNRRALSRYGGNRSPVHHPSSAPPRRLLEIADRISKYLLIAYRMCAVMQLRKAFPPAHLAAAESVSARWREAPRVQAGRAHGTAEVDYDRANRPGRQRPDRGGTKMKTLQRRRAFARGAHACLRCGRRIGAGRHDRLLRVPGSLDRASGSPATAPSSRRSRPPASKSSSSTAGRMPTASSSRSRTASPRAATASSSPPRTAIPAA